MSIHRLRKIASLFRYILARKAVKRSWVCSTNTGSSLIFLKGRIQAKVLGLCNIIIISLLKSYPQYKLSYTNIITVLNNVIYYITLDNNNILLYTRHHFSLHIFFFTKEKRQNNLRQNTLLEACFLSALLLTFSRPYWGNTQARFLWSSLSSVANIVIVFYCIISFSDGLPGHQASLDILRNSSDFVQYILTVTHQKLTQVISCLTLFCLTEVFKDV